jgi:hypothetical protein
LSRMDLARRQRLIRLASAHPRSSSEVMLQAQSIATLIEANEPVPLERVREILGQIIENQFGTYQSARAVSIARNCLDLLDGQPDLEWPSDDPWDQVSEGEWPWDRDPPDAEQIADDEWLYLGDCHAQRTAWRVAICDPPWARVNS